MSKPDREHCFEFQIEVPGTPEQVWDAIATSGGISSWFLRTEVEEREGGTIVTYMGPEDSSPGTVTGWDPPHRFVYEEPGWAGLAGREGAEVSPLVTEFIVEARSKGTCVVRVTSSAFGTGADWENEFFEGMAAGWTPFFDRLRLYLQHFPGERGELLEVQANLPGRGAAVARAIRERLGVQEVGQKVTINGLSGTVERVDDRDVLVMVSDPVPGYIGLAAVDGGTPGASEVHDAKEEQAITFVGGQFFGEGAAGFVESERPKWEKWLSGLGAGVPAPKT